MLPDNRIADSGQINTRRRCRAAEAKATKIFDDVADADSPLEDTIDQRGEIGESGVDLAFTAQFVVLGVSRSAK